MKCSKKQPCRNSVAFWQLFILEKNIYSKKKISQVLTDYQTTTYLQNNKKKISNFSRLALYYSYLLIPILKSWSDSLYLFISIMLMPPINQQQLVNATSIKYQRQKKSKEPMKKYTKARQYWRIYKSDYTYYWGIYAMETQTRLIATHTFSP